MGVQRRVRCVMAILGVAALGGGLLVAQASVAGAAPRPASFALFTDYPTGASPNPTHPSVAIGDVNGDEIPDVVNPNFGANTLSIFLGVGDGTFGSPTTLDTGLAPASVVLADLDGDSVVDLVVANAWDNSIWVFLGTGNGTFAPHNSFAAGLSPQAMTAGDINGDEIVDLVLANSDVDEISVLLGDGLGQFGLPQAYATGDLPVSTGIGDFNDDGAVDLVAANVSSNTVSVLLNTISLGYTRTDFAVGAGPAGVAVGDLNGDGDLDLATANSANNRVSVLLGAGDGTFAAHVDFPTASQPLQVAIADLNRDSLPDLATTSGSDFVSVLPGRGDGTFAARTDFGTGPSPWGMAIGDLNSDTIPDVVTTNFIATVSVLLNTTPAPTVPAAPTIGTAAGHNQSASVSWTEPIDGGSQITGYVVTPYIGYFPLAPQTFNSTATTQVVTGLTNGTTYRFRVQAVNVLGTGPYSKVSSPVTPTAEVPDAPTIGTATAGTQSATVTWTPPASDGGSPLTAYVVTAYVGFSPNVSVIAGPAATSRTVAGLSSGTTYRFRVRAFNAIGAGAFSKASNPVTPT